MSHRPSAILLDRDGVLVELVPDPLTGRFESPLHPEDVALVDGAAGAVATLAARCIPVSVVSNQPAAAKGTVPMPELRATHERVVELLAAAEVTIERWEYCFHHPDGVVAELSGPCDCRKPAAGLLRRALAATGAEPARSWMVGDSDTDVLAGCDAGTMTALLDHPRSAHRRTGSVPNATCSGPDMHAAGLLEFVQRLSF